MMNLNVNDVTAVINEMRDKIAYRLHKETNTTWLVTSHRKLLDFHFHMKTGFPKRYDRSSRELPEVHYARISQSLSFLDLDTHIIPSITDLIVDDASSNYFSEKERLENAAK